MDRAELRNWIEDALTRHDRDTQERGEAASEVTVTEILDAVWGRLPLDVRRGTSRAQVQASLTMITLRRGIALAHDARHRGSDVPELVSDLSGWRFTVDEVSAGVYEVRGVDRSGRSVVLKGGDPDELLGRCRARAAEISDG